MHHGLVTRRSTDVTVVKLKVGERYRRELILRELVEMFYERNDLELRRGRFACAGTRWR